MRAPRIRCLVLGAAAFLPPALALQPSHAADYAGRGVYYLTTAGVSPPLSAFTNASVDGIAARMHWDDLEPAEGNYSWTYFDTIVASATTYGKKVSFTVTAGLMAPDWLYDVKGAAPFAFIGDSPYTPLSYCQEVRIPIPWDPVYQAEWKKVIRAMAERYASHPAVSHVKMTGVNSRTEELALPKSTGAYVCNSDYSTCCWTYDDVQNWLNAGYTRTKVEDAWKSIAEVIVASFPAKGMVLDAYPGGFPPIDDAGNRIAGLADYQVATDLMGYGIAHYGPNLILQNDGLSATWVWPTMVDKSTYAATGYQMLWWVSGETSCRMIAGRTPCDAHAVLDLAVRKGICGGAKYLEIYSLDVADANLADVIAYAHESLTHDSTPPTVTLTLPGNGVAVSSVVSVNATASDDVCMRGVQFQVDGANIGDEDPAEFYSRLWDTTLVAPGWHSLTAVARDHLNNLAVSAPAAVFVSGTVPSTLSFNPTADAYVDKSNPDTNYGTATTLKAKSGSFESYLRFVVNGANGTVRSARLRLYPSVGSANGTGIFLAPGGWTEAGVNWNNQPGHPGPYPSDDGYPAFQNVWYDLNVTTHVAGDGTYDFHLSTNPLNLAANFTQLGSFYSKEGFKSPQLVMVISPPPSAAPAMISASALGISSVSWTWDLVFGAASYKLYPSTGGPAIAVSGVTQYLNGLSTNTAYGARASGTGAGTEGPLSAYATAYTFAAAPVDVALVKSTSFSATISWSTNTNPSGTVYQASWWTSGGTEVASNVTTSSAVATGLAAGKLYYLTLKALNGDGIAAPSGVVLSTITSGGAAQSVSPGSGGVITLDQPSGPSQVEIPPGALSENVTLTLSAPSSFAAASSGSGLEGVGVGVEVALDKAVQPSKYVDLSIAYRDSDIAGKDESKLIMARYDPAPGWIPLLSTVDAANNKVTARTRHFSVFQIMVSNPADTLSRVKVVPNPFRPHQGHAAMGFFNLPSFARLRVYTQTGELIKDFTANAAGLASWDCTNMHGKTVASGVYQVLAQGAHGSRTLAVAVQR